MHGNGRQHGKDPTAHDNVFVPRQRLCRRFLARRTAKKPLPEMTLPCVVCRASAHGNAVAVRFVPFAVRTPRTAKLLSPVVLDGSFGYIRYLSEAVVNVHTQT
jgi:hypothetical protein